MKPWERDWSDQKETPSASSLPWEMDWGSQTDEILGAPEEMSPTVPEVPVGIPEEIPPLDPETIRGIEETTGLRHMSQPSEIPGGPDTEEWLQPEDLSAREARRQEVMDTGPSVFNRQNWPVVAADLAAGALYEGPRRMVEKASNLRDQAIEGLTGIEVAPSLGGSTGVPYEPQTNRDVVEVGATIIPTIIGGKGAAKATEGLKVFWQRLAGTLGATGGYVASKERGEDRLFVGENSLAQELFGTHFEGFNELSEEGKRSEMAAIANDFVDAAGIAYPVERAADKAIIGMSLLWNTVLKPAAGVIGSAVRSPEAQKAAAEGYVSQKIISHIGILRNAKNPQEREAALLGLARVLKEEGSEHLQIDGEDIRMFRDVATAAEQGAESGMIDDIIAQRLRGVRTTQIQSGTASELGEVAAAPGRQIDRLTDTRFEDMGGMEAVEDAQRGVQRQAKQKFDTEFDTPVREAQGAREQAGKDLSKIFSDDPALEPALRRLESSVDVNLFDEKNRTVDQVRSVTRQAYDTMKEESDNLVAKIPEGTLVDFDLEDDAILDALTDAPKYLKKYLDIDTDDAGDVLSVTGDFKELYTNVIPKMGRDIGAKLRSGDVSGADDLMQIRNAIVEYIEDIPEAQAFRDFYKGKWAPTWADGKLEDFADVYRQTTRRGDTIRPVDFEVETRKIIEDSIQEPAYARHFQRLLESDEGGKNATLMTDLVLSDFAGNLQRQINRGVDLADADMNTLLAPLERMGAALERINPGQKKRLDSVLTKVRDSKGNLEKLDQNVKELQKVRDDAEKAIFQQDYKEFFDAQLRPLGIEDSYQSFETLFKDKTGSARFNQIVDLARNGGEEGKRVLTGMQAAYLRYMRNELVRGGPTLPGGGKGVNLDKYGSAISGEGNLFSRGEKLFEDSPETMDLFKALYKEGEVVTKSYHKAPKGSALSPQAIAQAGSRGWDRIITLTFGVLNRAAARARALKGAVVEFSDPKDQIEYITDKFLADSEYASDIIRRMARVEGSSGLDATSRRALEDWLVFSVPGLSNEDARREIKQNARDLTLSSGEDLDYETEMLRLSEDPEPYVEDEFDLDEAQDSFGTPEADIDEETEELFQD